MLAICIDSIGDDPRTCIVKNIHPCLSLNPIQNKIITVIEVDMLNLDELKRLEPPSMS